MRQGTKQAQEQRSNNVSKEKNLKKKKKKENKNENENHCNSPGRRWAKREGWSYKNSVLSFSLLV
jgi:hypothetical protein